MVKNLKRKSKEPKRKSKVRKSKVAKGVTIPTRRERELEKKPGGSSTGRYKRVAPSDFAGKAGGTSPFSYPINTLKRAKAALAYAHNAPNPAGIKRAVYAKYPALKKRKMEREGKSSKR